MKVTSRVGGFVLPGLTMIALGGSGILAAGVMRAHTTNPTSGTRSPTQIAGPDQLEEELALHDLRLLQTQLTFKPLLPPSLSLPPGHSYKGVVWGSAPANGFGIFISSQDPTAGNRAIHIDESAMSPTDLADPRFPMNAFKSVLKPVTLANGVWYEMQQQHEPEMGAWILATLRGNIAIQIDGLESREALEQFAGRLTTAS